MDAWVLFAIAAAAAQTLRFAVQKRLTMSGLSTAGATFARFVYSAPLILAGALLALGFSGAAIPEMSAGFWGYALSGGLAQILATMCVVAIFRHRNFAVGISFKKTEVILTALVGWAVLGDAVGGSGWAALGIGLVGVLLLSGPPEATGSFPRNLLNRAAALGLLSGVFFAISAVGYRGATLALGVEDLFLRTGWTLAMVTTSQMVGLGLWLIWREPGQIRAVLGAWRGAGLVGLFSMIGSFCWFAAFSLERAAYVFAVGQIELVFSIFVATLFFGERVRAREYAGMALLTVSIVAIVMVG